VKHDDHLEHAWVKSLYHLDIGDTSHFAVVLDACGFSTERLIEIVLAAGGVTAAETAGRR
jgi:cytidylate kinase